MLLPESRPGREGVGVAEELAAETALTLTSDAAFPGSLATWNVDILVVGADAVLPDGAVRNKVGTHPAAAVAARLAIPVLVATAVDKIAPTAQKETEPRPATHLYDGAAALSIANPTFEYTPTAVIDEFVTDRGRLTSDDLAAGFADSRHALDDE